MTEAAARYTAGHLWLVMLFTFGIAAALVSAAWAGRLEAARLRERRAAYAEARRETAITGDDATMLVSEGRDERQAQIGRAVRGDDIAAAAYMLGETEDTVRRVAGRPSMRWVYHPDGNPQWVQVPDEPAEYVTEAFSIDDADTPPDGLPAVVVCVNCGTPWEPATKNVCATCGGFCTWGRAVGADPDSWERQGDGWVPRRPPPDVVGRVNAFERCGRFDACICPAHGVCLDDALPGPDEELPAGAPQPHARVESADGDLTTVDVVDAAHFGPPDEPFWSPDPRDVPEFLEPLPENIKHSGSRRINAAGMRKISARLSAFADNVLRDTDYDVHDEGPGQARWPDRPAAGQEQDG